MATTRRVAVQKKARAGSGAELERALRTFLKAIPFDHLDQRLTALETWVTGLEKELRRSGGRVGRAAAETARIAVMGPRPAAKRPTTHATGRAVHRTR